MDVHAWISRTNMAKKIPRLTSQDPRDFPTYSIGEAAAFINIAPATLWHWTQAKNNYGYRRENFEPLIKIADEKRGLLSFFNLVEAHILRITRKEYSIPMLQVHRALDYVRKQYPSAHPLLQNDFRIFGKSLFVKELKKEIYINASRGGQLGIARILERYLERITFDKDGMPSRIYPVVGSLKKNTTAPVMVDPNLSSGRLVIEGTRIMVVIAAQRIQAGETYESLGRDYRIPPDKIRRAIQYFEKAAA